MELRTLVQSLRTCAKEKDLHKGSKLHADFLQKGSLDKNPIVATTLINMYIKCGILSKARQVHDCLAYRNVFSWNVLIAGYAQQMQGNEAIGCFLHMQREGISPDAITFTCILKACGMVGALQKGKQIHYEIVNRGLLEKDIILGNTLVDMYAKCGFLPKAVEVHHMLPFRDVVSWNALITGYVQNGQGREALNCYELMHKENIFPDVVTFICILKACSSMRDLCKGKRIHDEINSGGFLEKSMALGNALVNMYAKCGLVTMAQALVNELPQRDQVSWSALISGYVEQDQANEALMCFEKMQCEGYRLDAVSFICILKACSGIGAIEKGKQLHNEIVNRGLLKEYVVLATTLIDMYSKCNLLAKAQQVLEELTFRDSASWNALMTGYAQQGHANEVLNCYERMQREGLSPDAVTFASILKACGSIGAIEKGKIIHNEIVNRCLLEKDFVLGNILIDMYAKCNLLVKAHEVLEQLPVRDAITWTTLISGYSQEGQCIQALNCFENMLIEGISPNEVTFLSVLNACSHSGQLDTAKTFFANMDRKYGCAPTVEHQTCMVAVFGSAGHFDKMVSVIKTMPSSSDYSLIWITILGACRKWGNVKLGRLAFDQVVQLDSNLSSTYLLMSEIYSAAGMHADAEKVEAMRMKNIFCDTE